MMVFTFKNGSRITFCSVDENGDVFVSAFPFSGLAFLSTPDLKDVRELVLNGTLEPYNTKSAVYAKELVKKERNKNIALLMASVAVAVGSIILGVWS